MDRQDVFQAEKKKLLTPFFKALVTKVLQDAPIEFFIAPASSSGQYHKAEDNVTGMAVNGVIVETGGLVHHTQNVFRLAEEGIRQKIGDGVVPYVHDAILAAALLHDVLKSGNPWGGKTVKDHGERAAMWIALLLQETSLEPEQLPAVKLMLNAIMLHMGRWAVIPALVEVQRTIAADIVADADYWASRQYVHLDAVA